MAVLRKRAELHPSEASNFLVVGKLNKPCPVHGQRMPAMVTQKALVGVICALALIFCANASTAPTARSGLSINGESILREVTSRRNCSRFRHPSEGISAQDYWIYRAFGGGHFYDPKRRPKFEFSWSLVVGSVLAILGSAMGSVGGVGGGGFYLPMLNTVMRFDPTTSVALSKAMVMGVAASAVVFNLKRRHPTEARAVINYEFSRLFQPMILLGISTGVILNTLLPDWLVTFFLVALFTKLIMTTCRKANEIAEKEKQERQENSRNAAIISASHDESDYGDYFDEIPSSSRSLVSDPDNAAHEKDTWQWFPKKALAVLFLTWSIFLALQIVKTMVPDCTLFFWIATALQVPVAFAVTIWAAFTSTFAKQGEGTEREEVSSTTKGPGGQNRAFRNLVLSLLGLLAGIAGGLLGVGGGGILGPGFLELGLSPQEASSTANFIMVFSSSLSVVEYGLLGQLPKEFAIYFLCLAVVASIFGQVFIKKLVVSSGRTSIIVYILVACIAVGNVTLGILGAIRIVERLERGENMGFQKFCPSK